MRGLVWLLILILLVGGGLVWRNLTNKENLTMEKINLTTADGVTIVGNYYPADGEAAAVLLHQFSKDKNSWEDLPTHLNQAGIAVLAIDLRGHGESGGSKDDLAKATSDVAAAREFLTDKDKTRQVVVGASVGANLALLELGRGAAKVVALSPGLEYKGIIIDASRLGAESAGQALVVASQEDAYSFESAKQIQAILGDKRSRLLIYQGAGHGTNMFGPKPELKQKIVDFLSQ